MSERQSAENVLRLVMDAAEDPWCHSQEGLDDGCLFCGSSDSRWYQIPDPNALGRINPWVADGLYKTDVTDYYHRDDCAWIVMTDWLGRRPERHFTYTHSDGVVDGE